MRLIAINHLTALIYLFDIIVVIIIIIYRYPGAFKVYRVHQKYVGVFRSV